MRQTIQTILDRSPVIPVLVIEDMEDAIPLAEALCKGGLDVLEITLRSPVALDAAAKIKQAIPEAVVGLGTIMTPAQLDDVVASGLDFGVSPGMLSGLLSRLQEVDLPFLPGTGTVSEIMALQAAGFDAVKFFPAAASGGAAFVKSVLSVLPNVVICPTGGVTPENANDYLTLDNVKAVGGTWIAPQNFVRDKNWAEIEARARAAAQL